MFIAPGGKKYTRFLTNLHATYVFDWYLEIGCRTGRTFGPVKGKTIAVDPYFRVASDVIGDKPALHVLQQTSDDFFDSGFLESMKIKLSVSFLDGMHLFEFLLRDFMNTEARSREDGVILMHDCIPYTSEMTTRDIASTPRGPWTGDVWKIIPVLQEFRPDLKITMLDCIPTGLVLVTNLAPKNTVLKRKYDDIIARFTELKIEDFGIERFNTSFSLTSAEAYAADGYPDFKPLALPADSVKARVPTRG
ncbi:MAG: hypothetical protein RL216_3178 [Pseudomonadota bacterium]|jgi:hypothetical protein